MFDAVELLLLTLAIVLAGSAFALGATWIRQTWRDALPAASGFRAQPAETARPWTALHAIAAFEALKALAVPAAGAGLLWLAAHPTELGWISSIAGHFGWAAREEQAFSALDVLRSTERGPMVLAAAGYAIVHLVEAWGLWHQRSWGEVMGAASGAAFVPLEFVHLLHRPGWPSAALLVLNLAVVAYLVGRIKRRRRRTR